VLYCNKKGKLEILDGQQRVDAIIRYLNDEFTWNDCKYRDLDKTSKDEFNAYPIYYILLESSLTEQQVSDIFIRLQEGTPLNTAEKVNAFTGRFRDAFIKLHESALFNKLKNKRFRSRLLAAQFMLLELETNFDKSEFPSLSYDSFKKVNEKYRKRVPKDRVKHCNVIVDLLRKCLINQANAIPYRDWISIYLLTSYLHLKTTAVNNLGPQISDFAMFFLGRLRKFSIYNTSPPRGMSQKEFKKYMEYKQVGRRAIHEDSIKKRFEIILDEYKKRYHDKIKDERRLFTEAQKRKAFYEQGGRCSLCREELDYDAAECHHHEPYGEGGPTVEENIQVVHPECHKKLTQERKSRSSVKCAPAPRQPP